MKKLYIFVLLGVLVFSCSSDDDGYGETYNYTFTEQSELTVVSYDTETYIKYGEVNPGEKLVF
ncbi:hypothetical protein [Formosa sp. L2A11]|uniref:hypothetical protein n=1 Tax=Formosa sp. L2A11 TaxID=2686363 RepID=UPI00131AFF88|nr:hypothetical protein [Formosa sp. L2A11]